MTQSTRVVDLMLLNPIIEKYKGRKQHAQLPLLHESQALYDRLPREIQEIIGRTLRVPFCLTIRELLDMAGGLQEGKWNHPINSWNQL